MGQARKKLTSEDNARIVQEILEDLGLADDRERSEEIRKEIQENAFTLVDGGWSGKEIFEIDHLNEKAIVRLNHRHIFVRDVYDPLKSVAKAGANGTEVDALVALIRRTLTALDLLFLAHAKAENLHRDPAIFENLRCYWGQSTHSFMRELPNGE
ncbi:hypothetical protein [Embleya sp. AB8]|uniref:hypothetical protein n=1 Tax=Embleya sp. AB8 TaxID=3156304 RepID=UPI003C735976